MTKFIAHQSSWCLKYTAALFFNCGTNWMNWIVSCSCSVQCLAHAIVISQEFIMLPNGAVKMNWAELVVFEHRNVWSCSISLIWEVVRFLFERKLWQTQSLDRLLQKGKSDLSKLPALIAFNEKMTFQGNLPEKEECGLKGGAGRLISAESISKNPRVATAHGAHHGWRMRNSLFCNSASWTDGEDGAKRSCRKRRREGGRRKRGGERCEKGRFVFFFCLFWNDQNSSHKTSELRPRL